MTGNYASPTLAAGTGSFAPGVTSNAGLNDVFVAALRP